MPIFTLYQLLVKKKIVQQTEEPLLYSRDVTLGDPSSENKSTTDIGTNDDV